MEDNIQESKVNISETYKKLDIQRDIIIKKLRNNGCRITKQRLFILDIVLNEDCSSCKEIYYKASKQCKGIGFATVYRLMNMLEAIGAVKRNNVIKVENGDMENDDAFKLELKDNSVIEISKEKMKSIVKAGLEANGFDVDTVKKIIFQDCKCENM